MYRVMYKLENVLGGTKYVDAVDVMQHIPFYWLADESVEVRRFYDTKREALEAAERVFGFAIEDNTGRLVSDGGYEADQIRRHYQED